MRPPSVVQRRSPVGILIGSAGSTASQNLARALPGSRWKAWAADMSSRHSGVGLYVEEFCVPPAREVAAYRSAITSLLDEQRGELFVPVMEPELAAMAVSEDARVLISSERAIHLCRSKRSLDAALREAGFSTPEILQPPFEHFPLFLRPDFGTGSRGARVLRSSTELELAQEDDSILCPLLEGQQLSIDGFACSAHQLRGLVARSRDEVRHGLAVRSTVVASPPELTEPLQAFLAAAGIVGFFNLQCIQHEGAWLVHDFNPRLGGAMFLSFCAGLDPGSLLDAWLKRGAWPTVEPQLGLSLVRRFENVILQL